jgi:two-component system, cell cycle response regulator DivK
MTRQVARVLLVEDNEMNRDMLSRRLTRKGYHVTIAGDGAEGVAMAERSAPDLVLLDLSLPVMDGWTTARELRSRPSTRAIPIIALTAHAMAGDRERALEAGCDDFDTKPVDLQRLLGKMDTLLSGQGGRSGEAETATPIVLEGSIENLPDLLAYVTEGPWLAGADADTLFSIRLATEELFTNIVRHGYPDGPGPVEVDVSVEGGRLLITMRDRGISFDPTSVPPPDLSSDWRDRQAGGLGWHLLNQLVDEVHHRPGTGGGNVVTLIKRLASEGASLEQPMDVEIRVETRGHTSVVAIRGSVDGLTADRVQTALSEQVEMGNVFLVGDLGELEYTSSAGLRVLLGAVKDARRRGGDLRLASVSSPVHRVLEMSGFTSILRMFEDVEKAVESYAE